MTVSQDAPERTSSEAIRSVFAWCEQMRATDPVHLDEQAGTWHTFRYAETAQVLGDPKTFSSDFLNLYSLNKDVELFCKGNFVGMDPPEQRRLRGLVSKAFTPRLVAGMEPRIDRIVSELLDEVAGKERFDVISTLAYPLPVTVIAEMIGVPPEDRPVFKSWFEAFLAQGGTKEFLPEQEQVDAFTPVAQEMNAYMLRHIRERKVSPRDDLISKLLRIEEEGSRLTEEEIVGFVALMLIAGHFTTTALLGNLLLCLEENPETASELRRDRSLIPGAVEETLRLRPPVLKIPRLCKQEAEVGGKVIPAGKIVTTWLASANRDELVFAEPNRFDVRRDPNRHLTMGHGIHFCIGAPLSRLEAKLAMNQLFDRYSDITVSRAEPVEHLDPQSLLGVKRLPLDVTPG
jgi:cytochrome P450